MFDQFTYLNQVNCIRSKLLHEGFLGPTTHKGLLDYSLALAKLDSVYGKTFAVFAVF